MDFSRPRARADLHLERRTFLLVMLLYCSDTRYSPSFDLFCRFCGFGVLKLLQISL